MTASGDYVPSGNGQDYEATPNYPTAFGIQLTPTISGVIVAILGLAGAVYLLANLVQPAWQRNQELSADIASKEAQLANQAESLRRIEEAREQLEEAQQLRADVLGLFASEETLDTLLLDINERIQGVNAGITDPERRAKLTRFEANDAASGVVNDSSLGTEVNGKLERRVFDVELEGNFPQTQSILRNIERLQPLLVVRDLNSELDSATQRIQVDPQGRVVPAGQPATNITTSFQLNALVPVTQSAGSAVVADPAAQPPAGQPPAAQPATPPAP